MSDTPIADQIEQERYLTAAAQLDNHALIRWGIETGRIQASTAPGWAMLAGEETILDRSMEQVRAEILNAAPGRYDNRGETVDLPPGPPIRHVTPLVAKIAAQRGVALASVTGTGAGGRVTKDDVLAAASTLPSSTTDDATYGELFGDDGSARRPAAASAAATPSAPAAPSSAKVAEATALLNRKSLQAAAAAQMNAPGELTYDEWVLLGDVAYGEGQA